MMNHAIQQRLLAADNVIALNPDVRSLRAVVFKEAEMYVAHCLEIDISAQGKDIKTAIDRLYETVEAEIDFCKNAYDIPQAPIHFHYMWANRTIKLERLGNNSIEIYLV